MKKAISFLLVLIFVFLCSCSLPKEIEESVNLYLDFLQDKTITNIDNNDRFILIRSVPYVNEEEYYNASSEISYYYIWDIKRSRLKASFEQRESHDDDNYISDIEINNENEITLYTYNNPKQSQVYDLSFKLIGSCNDSYVTKEEKLNYAMKNSDLINVDRFAGYGNFATDSFYIINAVSVFLDDPDNVYVTDNDNAFNVIATNEKRILTSSYDENSILNEYFYYNDYSKAQVILAMYDFEKCLSTFPAELCSEIISSENGFDKLKFYFVGRFDSEKNSNDISAYCSNFNGELFIVYSVNSFTYSTFCHELMHAMEYRINDNVSDFYNEWDQLNPDGFEYTYFDNERIPFYENEEYQQYFARDYGTNNQLEDRATVFEEVCSSDFINEESPWWAEKNPLSKKASYLKTVIKRSYPSLSNLWEKYDNLI